MDFKTTDYFIANHLDYLPDSFDEKCIPKDLLTQDLNSISKEWANELFEKEKPKNWKTLCRVYDDDSLTLWKKCIILKKIQEDEMNNFLDVLINTNKPYDEEDLKNLNVDSKGLVDLREFIQYKIDNKIKNKYCICLPVRNHRFYEQVNWSFLSLRGDKSTNIRLRLDPLIKYPKSTMSFEMISGKLLNWDELCDVEEDVPVLCKNYDESIITQIYWKRRGDEFHFFCEELPAYEERELLNSRYYHAKYNTKLKKITHFDASTKIYTSEELLQRMNMKIWNKNCKKFKKYYKIYKVDGEIDTDIFTIMITYKDRTNGTSIFFTNS